MDALKERIDLFVVKAKGISFTLQVGLQACCTEKFDLGFEKMGEQLFRMAGGHAACRNGAQLVPYLALAVVQQGAFALQPLDGVRVFCVQTSPDIIGYSALEECALDDPRQRLGIAIFTLRTDKRLT